MPSGDAEMIIRSNERAVEYRSSQVAFTSELVQRIQELSQKNLELEGENFALKEQLQGILNAELKKSELEEQSRRFHEEHRLLIENYGRNGACTCKMCNPKVVGLIFIVCPICGNKRCPHASNHLYECTNSNSTGQEGSVY